jgi:hypothetical protein
MDDDNIKPITNQGFFTYVFKLSKFKQEDLLNIIQYTVLSIVPVMLFIYFTKKYFPLVNEDDSSIYILTVTIIELIFMMVGIFFIDRIINYIPTYSGKYYETINLTTIILIFILFMLLTHGGFRLRTALLLQRFDDWFTIDDIIARKLGLTPKPFDITMEDVQVVPKKGKGNKKAGNGAPNSNGQSGGQQMSQQYATPAPLPTQGPIMPNPMANYGGGAMPTQQVQNFNAMYTNPATSMNGGGGMGGGGGGGMGGDDSYMEPMAANAVLGGGCGSWSSW